jgi:beta-lactamase class A
MHDLTRRGALLAGFALTACAQRDWRDHYQTPPNDPRFAAIEARIGGRVGVTACNLATDEWLWHRARERFAMCSTFKWALAAAQLHMAQNGGPQLDEQLRFDESDLLDYAPVAREHIARGWMTIEQACAGAVVVSDNTAANLLLEIQGGPEGFTRFVRANADTVMRLDRTEPSLNEVPLGDRRDTTMPEGMVIALKRLLVNEDVLSAEHRNKIIGWMVESPTGRSRLRAGLPADWRVGDKTGTWNGRTNATNDVAIAWPPGRAPIIIASYLSASTVEPEQRNAAHAEIARIIAEEWA